MVFSGGCGVAAARDLVVVAQRIDGGALDSLVGRVLAALGDRE